MKLNKQQDQQITVFPGLCQNLRKLHVMINRKDIKTDIRPKDRIAISKMECKKYKMTKTTRLIG